MTILVNDMADIDELATFLREMTRHLHSIRQHSAALQTIEVADKLTEMHHQIKQMEVSHSKQCDMVEHVPTQYVDVIKWAMEDPENYKAMLSVLGGNAAIVPVEATPAMCLAWERSSDAIEYDNDVARVGACKDWSVMLKVGRLDKTGCT